MAHVLGGEFTHQGGECTHQGGGVNSLIRGVNALVGGGEGRAGHEHPAIEDDCTAVAIPVILNASPGGCLMVDTGYESQRLPLLNYVADGPKLLQLMGSSSDFLSTPWSKHTWGCLCATSRETRAPLLTPYISAGPHRKAAIRACKSSASSSGSAFSPAGNTCVISSNSVVLHHA
eukprot:885317-Prorocentrum_minimum.AAC.3